LFGLCFGDSLRIRLWLTLARFAFEIKNLCLSLRILWAFVASTRSAPLY